jgi:hypothetical protein
VTTTNLPSLVVGDLLYAVAAAVKGLNKTCVLRISDNGNKYEDGMLDYFGWVDIMADMFCAIEYSVIITHGATSIR